LPGGVLWGVFWLDKLNVLRFLCREHLFAFCIDLLLELPCRYVWVDDWTLHSGVQW